MGKFFGVVLVGMMAFLAWWAWNPPFLMTQLQQVRFSIPNISPLEAGKWRVVTRRIVWKKTVKAMRKELNDMGFPLTLIRKREPIELHAFDDVHLFSSRKEALAAQAWWNKQHIDAAVFDVAHQKGKQGYRVELGRYYLSAYAKEAQKELKQVGKPYSYEKRQVMIPSYRFAFPVMMKSEAEILWRRLQNMGVADPVMMQAVKFNELYKNYANKSAKRSNK